MGPDDANVACNVHGGNLMTLIDEAGGVAATRYCNDTLQHVCMLNNMFLLRLKVLMKCYCSFVQKGHARS